MRSKRYIPGPGGYGTNADMPKSWVGKKPSFLSRRSRCKELSDPAVLEKFKALLRAGVTEMSAAEAVRLSGASSYSAFYQIVHKKYVERGVDKLMNLSSLVSWLALGVSVAEMRKKPRRNALSWMREEEDQSEL